MDKKLRDLAAGSCAALLSIVPVCAQVSAASSENASVPPVHGVVALDDTMKKFYRAANVGLVATWSGVEHAYRFSKSLMVESGETRGRPVAALEGLREGTPVMIRCVVPVRAEQEDAVGLLNSEDLMATEGWVAHIDRRRLQVTVKYDDGSVDILKLTERAGAETWPEEEREMAAQIAGAEAAMYYNDEDGQRIVHFFRWVR